MTEAKRTPIDKRRDERETSDDDSRGGDAPDDRGRGRVGGDVRSKGPRPHYDPPDESIPIDPPDNTGGGW